MKLTFYSKPGCPQCKVLKMKMDAAGVEYTHIESEEAIMALGQKGAPVLVADDEMYVGPNAVKWFTDWERARKNGN